MLIKLLLLHKIYFVQLKTLMPNINDSLTKHTHATLSQTSVRDYNCLYKSRETMIEISGVVGVQADSNTVRAAIVINKLRKRNLRNHNMIDGKQILFSVFRCLCNTLFSTKLSVISCFQSLFSFILPKMNGRKSRRGRYCLLKRSL